MRIVVVGAGAMGCLFGGKLKEKGQDVVLVDVNPRHIEKINADGLRMDIGEQTKIIKLPAKYANEVEETADLVIIFTKTLYAEKALESAKHFIGPETYVFSLQNGLGNIEKIEKVVSRDRIIVGTTNFASDMEGPGHIKSKGSGMVKIMSVDGQITDRLRVIETALNAAGFNCEITPDVFAAIWEKIAFNAAFNSLTAITKLTCGPIAEPLEGKKLVKQVASEVIDVANKLGINARKNVVMEMLENSFIAHAGHMPSMLQDILAERPTEIESINGAVVREANKVGLAVPATEVSYLLIRILEQSYGKFVTAH